MLLLDGLAVFHRAAALAFARVLAGASVVAGFATAFSFAGILAFAVVSLACFFIGHGAGGSDDFAAGRGVRRVRSRASAEESGESRARQECGCGVGMFHVFFIL